MMEEIPGGPSVKLRTHLFDLILLRRSDLIPGFLKKYPDAANWRLHEDMTPLMDAVMQDYSEIAKMLLEAGARVGDRTKDNRVNAMHYCGRSPNCIDLLLEYGADINDKISNGETALNNAMSNNNFVAALKLVERGADVNNKGAGWSPLLGAAWSGEAALCAALLRAGADLNAVDGQGWNALQIARGGFKNCEDKEKYRLTLKVLEPAYAAKSQEELQTALRDIAAEIDKGTDKPVAICKPLRFKPRSFYRLYTP
ncbi:MAG: ankyrin repeat domain-containing protein [Alphaproteobacteria bacterium]